MVLYFDRPFEEADLDLGLTRSAELRMQSSSPKDDIFILVSEGYHLIPESVRMRMRDLRYNIVDASGIFSEIRAEWPEVAEKRISRGQKFLEMCYLRWMVLERYFDSSPVLAMDSDVVWRRDPYEMLKSWKSGGSFLCGQSVCMIFVGGSDWYEQYRVGLGRHCHEEGFGSEYTKQDFSGIYHDQALIQYLVKIGALPNDQENFAGHGFSEEFLLVANPLLIAPQPGEQPYAFERSGFEERVGGKVVPFWHMQSSFIRYLFTVYATSVLLGGYEYRVPYGRYGTAKELDAEGLFVLFMNHIHLQTKRGKVSFGSSLSPLNTLTQRGAIYDEFFRGDLAAKVFNDRRWWKPGVWAA